MNGPIKRWVRAGVGGKFVEAPKTDAFLKEIEAVCKKHKKSIGHEDGHGSFIIGTFGEFDGWLQCAGVTTRAVTAEGK